MEKHHLIKLFLTILFFIVLVLFMNYIEYKDRIYIDKSHSLFHFQDTIKMNGKKYIRVFDENGYEYPQTRRSYLMEVK